jgi:dynein regulatry complex protein 1
MIIHFDMWSLVLFIKEEFVRERFERYERFERELQQLRIKQAEEFNATKVKLENQIQEQQRRIEEMKAVYQLSQEKYEYNYKVLKKRDEENAWTINVQKNRKIKLNDLLTNLKHKLVQKEKQFKAVSIQAAEEYKRTLANIQEIKRKAK